MDMEPEPGAHILISPRSVRKEPQSLSQTRKDTPSSGEAAYPRKVLTKASENGAFSTGPLARRISASPFSGALR